MHSVRQHVMLRFRRRSRFRLSWRRKRSVWMLWWKQNATEPWRLTKRLTSCAKSSGWGEEDKHKPCHHGFWFEVRNYVPVNASHFNSRAKQQIYEQIQKRLVDKIMQEEIQKLERQQEVEKQEKSYLEDLKVHPIKRSPHQYLSKLNVQPPVCSTDSFLCPCRLWRGRRRNNGTCMRKTCASILRPSGPRSSGRKRRSCLIWETWNTWKRNW